MINIKNSGSVISEIDISAVEKALNIKFPSAYREFLLKFNGGRPQPNHFVILNNPSDTHGILEYFFGINAPDYSDIIKQHSIYANRIPKNLFPIATDPGGNLICIDLVTNKIFFWDHEEESEEGQIPSLKNIYPVANTFEELLNNLT